MAKFTLSHFNPLAKLVFLFFDCLLILNQIQLSTGGGGGYFQSDEDELVTEAMVHDFAHKDYMLSKGYLLRWLRVHDFDLDETLEKFKQSMQWRTDNDIDHIFKENFTAVDELYPFAVDGVDKEGRPIVWAPIGAYDVRKIVIAGEQELYQRYMMRMFEFMEIELHRLRETTGQDNITQAVMLFDLGGFNVKTGACLRCLGMIPEFMSNVELNYPNIFYKAYHVNTPALFESVFRVAKNLMSAQTKEALQIYDYNKDKWIAALLRDIPADQLPVQYGGTKPFDYYSMAANRNHLISSIIAFAETDSHILREKEYTQEEQHDQVDKDHRHHQPHDKIYDSSLTVNSISRRHMEFKPPDSEPILETIPVKDNLESHHHTSSSPGLVVSSSVNHNHNRGAASIDEPSLIHQADAEDTSPKSENANANTELPLSHVIRHHNRKHHHHHYKDVSPESGMESYKPQPRGLYLRSGANRKSHLFLQSISTFYITLLPTILVACVGQHLFN